MLAFYGVLLKFISCLRGILSRAKLRIFGKVHGVSYRNSAQNQAKLLKLTGWIKNIPDGSVLADVEGTPPSISQFIDWCKQGPVNARVQNVEVEWLDDTRADDKTSYQTSSFEIL
jgi:acylphosphatase